jgi:hypothetical protein
MCGVGSGMGTEWGRKRLGTFRTGESAGFEEAVVHGAWPGLRGGVGGGRTRRGVIHSMKRSCRSSPVGDTYAWRRGRRREGRDFGECSCGGEEAGCRREVVPNLHVGATSACGSGVTCCMVGRGVCGRVAVHEFACTANLTTSREFAMGGIPPMEEAVQMSSMVWTHRLLGTEGEGGRVVGAKG